MCQRKIGTSKRMLALMIRIAEYASGNDKYRDKRSNASRKRGEEGGQIEKGDQKRNGMIGKHWLIFLLSMFP